MLLYQFDEAVNEETAASITDLYSCLYDREVNKEQDRRSTLINFRQTMLDVEYIRYVVGPPNEIKIWTLLIGLSTEWSRFQEDGKRPPGSQFEFQHDVLEDKIEGWIREYCSQFEIAYGRHPDGFPYGNTRACNKNGVIREQCVWRST